MWIPAFAGMTRMARFHEPAYTGGVPALPITTEGSKKEDCGQWVEIVERRGKF